MYKSLYAHKLRGAPSKKMQGLFGHCPNGGGGGGGVPKYMPGWFGALIWRRMVQVQMGICLFFGVWVVWGTHAVKIEVQMAFAFVKGVKAYQDALWHLTNVKHL